MNDNRELLTRRSALRLAGAATFAATAGVGPLLAVPAEAAAEPNPGPADCRQLISVHSSAGATKGSLSAWQRAVDGSWRRILGPVPAYLGSEGIGAASESSSRTPAGTFALTEAFGRQGDPGTAMPYFRSDTLDWWDGNPSSPTYNLHVRRSSSPGGNSENLYYAGAVYDYAVNIASNPARTPGAGSAIFLHVTDGRPTAGCVAIGRSELVQLLRWLQPAQRPYATIRVGSEWRPTLVPKAQADNFIMALYKRLLGRAADAQGLATRSAAIQAGGDRAYAARSLSRSAERYRLVVRRAYTACLGRPADSSGLASRSARLSAGGTLAELYAALSSSGEAWNRAGKNYDRWVTQTFRALLGRPAAAGSSWATVARTKGLRAAADGIAGSAEFAGRQLDLLMLEMLGRKATSAERQRYGPSMRARGMFDVPGPVGAGAEFWRLSQA